MNIGIDIDDTLADTNTVIFEYACKYNNDIGLNYEVKKDEWDWDIACGWTTNELIEGFYKKYIDKALKKAEIKENAKDILEKLKKQDNKIFLVTSRAENEVEGMAELTKEWLANNNIPYDKLVLNSKNKSIVCIENNIDIFFDDNIRKLHGNI